MNEKHMHIVITKNVSTNQKVFLHTRRDRSYESSYEVARSKFFLQEIYKESKKTLSHLIIHNIVFRTFFDWASFVSLKKAMFLDNISSIITLDEEMFDAEALDEINSHHVINVVTTKTNWLIEAFALIASSNLSQIANSFRNTNYIHSQIVNEQSVINLFDEKISRSKYVIFAKFMTFVQIILSASDELILVEIYTSFCMYETMFVIDSKTTCWRNFNMQIEFERRDLQSLIDATSKLFWFAIYDSKKDTLKSISLEKVKEKYKRDERDDVVLDFRNYTMNERALLFTIEENQSCIDKHVFSSSIERLEYFEKRSQIKRSIAKNWRMKRLRSSVLFDLSCEQCMYYIKEFKRLSKLFYFKASFSSMCFARQTSWQCHFDFFFVVLCTLRLFSCYLTSKFEKKFVTSSIL